MRPRGAGSQARLEELLGELPGTVPQDTMAKGALWPSSVTQYPREPRRPTRAGHSSMDQFQKCLLIFVKVGRFEKHFRHERNSGIRNVQWRFARKLPWDPLANSSIGFHGMPRPRDPPLLVALHPGGPRSATRARHPSGGCFPKFPT